MPHPERANRSARTARCPACGGDDVVSVQHLPRAGIEASLIDANILSPDALRSCRFGDYDLMACRNCELEYADPMSEPDESFYVALAEVYSYYPSWRWEWEECVRIVDATRSKGGERDAGIVLLDVGCGSGRFLSYLSATPTIDAYGVDTNSVAVEQAKAYGLNAFACDLSDVRFHLPDGVDIVTLWHVLEHVSDPAGLLEQIKPLLRKGGRILLTVPISPQFYESSWSDPLNLPPHHLSRWRIKSLAALWKRVGMSGQLVLPAQSGLGFRVMRTWMLQAVGPFGSRSAVHKALRLSAWLLTHPVSATRDLGRQLKMSGKCAPALALVELRTA